MNINKHIARMSANGSIGDSIGNATKNRINSSFRDSPFYRTILVNGISTEVRIADETNFQKKTLTFRPDTAILSGSVCEIDTTQWLVINFKNNDIFPVATIQKCNHTLKWQRNSIAYSYPTVVLSPSKEGLYSDKVMTLASGQYQLYIAKNNDTIALQIGDRFFIGRDVYEIAYIDEITLDGILVFTLNKSPINTNDNVELGIADYTEPTDPEIPPNDNGGWW